MSTSHFITAVNRLMPYMESYHITICNKYDSSVNHVDECPDLENHLIGRVLSISSRIVTLEVNLTTKEYKFSALAAGTITGIALSEELAYLKEHIL